MGIVGKWAWSGVMGRGLTLIERGVLREGGVAWGERGRGLVILGRGLPSSGRGLKPGGSGLALIEVNGGVNGDYGKVGVAWRDGGVA